MKVLCTFSLVILGIYTCLQTTSAMHLLSQEFQDRMNYAEKVEEYLRLTPERTSNFTIVLAAVKLNGNSLEVASSELKNNRKIVLAAVQRDGCSLQFASETLKNDPSVVLAAVENNPKALDFASPKLIRYLESQTFLSAIALKEKVSSKLSSKLT